MDKNKKSGDNEMEKETVESIRIKRDKLVSLKLKMIEQKNATKKIKHDAVTLKNKINRTIKKGF